MTGVPENDVVGTPHTSNDPTGGVNDALVTFAAAAATNAGDDASIASDTRASLLVQETHGQAVDLHLVGRLGRGECRTDNNRGGDRRVRGDRPDGPLDWRGGGGDARQAWP